ncbi:MAG TPA: ribbon-helix-helix protein, CopG family [Thermodesulfobacteriota bacterium]|nr:ribbon-helix-helix protein, CopG family [Thermodesulfobacteriota bacterium]
MKQLTVRIPDDEYEVLTDICEEEGYSKVKLIRTLIRDFLKDKKSHKSKDYKNIEKKLRDAMTSGLLLNIQKEKPESVSPIKVKGKPLSRIILEDRE